MQTYPISAVFLDAAGTLFHLRESVGRGYAGIARTFGLSLDPRATDAAFRAQWAKMNPHHPGYPPPKDGKEWWRELVFNVLGSLSVRDFSNDRREAYFEALYAHYARPAQWIAFPEAADVLRQLRAADDARHLAVLSNFDRRLYGILEGLGLREFLDDIVISSEIGFSKPHPRIFEAACERAGVPPDQCLHAGDDPGHDWGGARGAGLQVFRLDRRRGSLEDLLEIAG